MDQLNSAGDDAGPLRRDFAPWNEPGARPLLRLENVGKRFDDVVAVDALSLDVYPGELFALLGPSGCGKTTLLRMLAGFETPSQGRMLLDGEDIGAVPPHRRPVNMMFQSYALFPHLTVEGNVAFGLRQEGLSKAETAARVEEMLALVQLTPLARRKPHQLSGGQRQRVALARALAKRPKLLLLDEPLAALDRKLRGETQFELMALQRRLGLTFIIVTHDQEEAMTMADRIGVMDRGRLVQVGAPAEIYEKPATRWVAEFVGDVNLVDAVVVEATPAGLCVDGALGTLRAPAQPDTRAGDTVWIALRPEKLHIAAASGRPAGAHCAAGQVLDIGYRGGISTYKVRLDSGLVLKAAAVNRARVVQQPIGWGDRVVVAWDPDAALVLTR